MNKRSVETYEHRYCWFDNPWLRRPVVVLLLPVILLWAALWGLKEGLKEAVSEVRSSW